MEKSVDKVYVLYYGDDKLQWGCMDIVGIFNSLNYAINAFKEIANFDNDDLGCDCVKNLIANYQTTYNDCGWLIEEYELNQYDHKQN
jgi:hypothetical protein